MNRDDRINHVLSVSESIALRIQARSNVARYQPTEETVAALTQAYFLSELSDEVNKLSGVVEDRA